MGIISFVLKDTFVLGKRIIVDAIVGATLVALRQVFFVVCEEKVLFDARKVVD